MIKNYGYIENFVQDDQLEKWKNTYKKVSTGQEYKDTFTWGIFDNRSDNSAKNSFGSKWFTNEVVPMIQDLLPKNTKYNFSSFNHMWGPLAIHQDLPPHDNLMPGRSICFPYSVNGNRRDFRGASTRIYDHNKKLIETLVWKPNTLIWWDGNLYHDSGDFDNFDYKEFFITQTSLEKSS